MSLNTPYTGISGFTRTLVLATALSWSLSCGSGGDSKAVLDQAYTDCDEIASRCHVHWEKSPAASQCHDLGHDPGKDPKMCTARKAECLALCPIVPKVPKDAGADPDAQASGASDGEGAVIPDGGEAAETAAPGPPDAMSIDPEIAKACTTYCECMTMTCTNKLSDPAFATPMACMKTCIGFQPAERKCWANFCKLASQGMSKFHNCDHAAGDLGLDECE